MARKKASGLKVNNPKKKSLKRVRRNLLRMRKNLLSSPRETNGPHQGIRRRMLNRNLLKRRMKNHSTGKKRPLKKKKKMLQRKKMPLRKKSPKKVKKNP